ncbi:MAG: DUF3025 domain-containing protein [Xanthomonadales bacterium]
MPHWKASIDTGHPCWDGYRRLLEALPEAAFPAPERLTGLLPRATRSRGGSPIRFVPAARLPGVDYERHIHETGEVATRDNWHDLCNALVWCRLPRFKAALNALHYDSLGEQRGGRRGARRDALTLLDESGVIVTGDAPALFAALAARDWSRGFVALRDDWRRVRVVVCGHAILEKFLQPYKALTAHALYLPDSDGPDDAALDRRLETALLREGRLRAPADLQPLPLMGIPGWWTGGAQDADFYADRAVFRPSRGLKSAAGGAQ